MSLVDPLPIPLDAPRRLAVSVLPPSDQCPSFLITAANRSYKRQYANIYFVRLRILRPFVEERAKKRWANIEGSPVMVPRVLDVVKSQICWIVGTVYMDMPLKPNVLEDIARDQSIPPPPPLEKICSPDDAIMLEDESGRIRLVGELATTCKGLVTGVIVAALGIETSHGDFEVVDLCYAGMAPQLHEDDDQGNGDRQMRVDDAAVPPATAAAEESLDDEWVAVVSGLEVGSPSPCDALVQLLVEYLTGEGGGPAEQMLASRISRLIIAGNSLAPLTAAGYEGDKKMRRYGHDPGAFSPHPTTSLSAQLLELARVMPVHLLPGARDPSGAILPQQPFPRAMFGPVSRFSTFACETNPTYLRLGAPGAAHDEDATETGGAAVVASSSSSRGGTRKRVERTFLVSSGQPLNDMWKYLPVAEEEGEGGEGCSAKTKNRLSLAESTLRWRHVAPTAPDTLWCHPYFATDPFIVTETPDVYVVGDQPELQTKLVVNRRRAGQEGGGGRGGEGASERCRIVLVPRFLETGVLVLVNMRTLGVKCVRFEVGVGDSEVG